MVVIPAIDLKGGKCVRLTQGRKDSETVYSENPVSIARLWESKGAGCLHIVDLDGAFSGCPVHLSLVREIADAVDIPVQLGGGIRQEDDVRRCIDAKVDRVIVGTRALADSKWLREICGRYPGRIAAGIDAREGKVAVEGWTSVSEKDPVGLAKELESTGVCCIVFTEITRDGMLEGPDIEATRRVAEAVSVPVIAAGGITTMEDIARLKEMPIWGFVIGKALYTNALELEDIIEFLSR